MTKIRTASNSLLRGEHGGAAVPFILALPIFLTILAVIIQFALLVNAKITLNQAAQATARAAMTSLPDELPTNVQRAARMSLAPVSPAAKTGLSNEAVEITSSLATLGINPGNTYGARYTYAEAVTNASYPNQVGSNFAYNEGQLVEVHVDYLVYLPVPIAQRFIGQRRTIAGIEGWFLQMRGTARVMTSHGRKTSAHSDGWPHQ